MPWTSILEKHKKKNEKDTEFVFNKCGINFRSPMIFIGIPGAFVLKAIADHENWPSVMVYQDDPIALAKLFDSTLTVTVEKKG